MSEQLKPCPLCGAEAIVSDWTFRGDGPEEFPQDVVCTGCGVGFCGQDYKGKGTAFVLAAWNRRNGEETA